MLLQGQIVRKHGCTRLLEAVCKTGGQGNAGDALRALALDSRTVDFDRDLPQLAGRRFQLFDEVFAVQRLVAAFRAVTLVRLVQFLEVFAIAVFKRD